MGKFGNISLIQKDSDEQLRIDWIEFNLYILEMNIKDLLYELLTIKLILKGELE